MEKNKATLSDILKHEQPYCVTPDGERWAVWRTFPGEDPEIIASGLTCKRADELSAMLNRAHGVGKREGLRCAVAKASGLA